MLKYKVIDRNDIERVCVVDKDGFFRGMISDRDLLIAFVDRHPGIWDYLTSKIPFTEKGHGWNSKSTFRQRRQQR